MSTNPFCQLDLAECARRNRQHNQCRLGLICNKAFAVEAEKGTCSNQRYAFVAVNERMIFCEPERIRRGQARQVRNPFIGEKILRSCQGRFEQTFIAEPVCAAVFASRYPLLRPTNNASCSRPRGHK